MNTLQYILLSGALSLPMMYLMQGCASRVRMRPSRGLAVSLAMAAEHTLLFLLGMLAGNWLRVGNPDYDSLVFLGFMVAVAIRMMASVSKRSMKAGAPAYDIKRWGTVLLLGVASGINLFLVGVAAGFIGDVHEGGAVAAGSLAAFSFLFIFWGFMLGHVPMPLHRRRWVLIATLAVLVISIWTALL